MLSIYPNPTEAGSTLTIRNNFNAAAFTLFNITSKVLLKGTLADKSVQSINLPSLPAGTYMVQVSGNNGENITQQIVIR